jgi:hypothetical protein
MARPQEAVQRYQRSGSSSCAVCDPLRPLHDDGTLFGLVFFDFTMHKSSASDGRRWSSEKLRHFACSSHDALLTRPQTRLGLHVSKCRASGACCLVNRACLDSCNKDQLKCTVEATAICPHDSCAVRIMGNCYTARTWQYKMTLWWTLEASLYVDGIPSTCSRPPRGISRGMHEAEMWPHTMRWDGPSQTCVSRQPCAFRPRAG